MFPLIVEIELKEGAGEDACVSLALQKRQIVGVFDGLGGSSSGSGNETGGRIAATTVQQTTCNFLKQKGGAIAPESVKELQQKLRQVLQAKKASALPASRIIGSLVKNKLCTTLALASFSAGRSGRKLSVTHDLDIAWIGDSRIYFLSPKKGLQQLTQDDIEVEKDAFELLREDSKMAQYLSADMPSGWEINFRRKNVELPGLVIACTDGAFHYLETPWQFEILLLESLLTSASVEEWRALLNNQYQKIKRDDTSIVIASIGFDNNFEVTKGAYQERLAFLQDTFSDEENFVELEEHWFSYRGLYEEKISNRLLLPNIQANIREEREQTEAVDTLVPAAEDKTTANQEIPKIGMSKKTNQLSIAPNDSSSLNPIFKLPFLLLSFLILQIFLLLGFSIGWLTAKTILEKDRDASEASSQALKKPEKIDSSMSDDQEEDALVRFEETSKQIQSLVDEIVDSQIATQGVALSEQEIVEEKEVVKDKVVEALKFTLHRGNRMEDANLDYAGLTEADKLEAQTEWVKVINNYQRNRVGLTTNKGFIDTDEDSTVSYLKCEMVNYLGISVESTGQDCLLSDRVP